jgi:hypothetical protein
LQLIANDHRACDGGDDGRKCKPRLFGGNVSKCCDEEEV